MYKGFKIPVPFFEIGPKAYLYGREALKLAQHADKIGQKFHVAVIFTPQYVDISMIARETEHLLVFAQHIDSLEIGRGIGSVLPESVKEAGAVGALLNHAEKKIPHAELERTIHRADAVGLASLVCADNIDEALIVAKMNPNIIIAESPSLIGVGKRDSNDRQFIQTTNARIKEINPEIRILHGAGISNGQDVFDVIAAGAQATGSTSGIIKAQDPFKMLEEMISAVRSAWDLYHSVTEA